MDVTPNFRSGIKSAKGRARPDEPLALHCEIAAEGVCTGRAEVRHHRRGRVGPDADLLTLDACDACHRHCHAHPALSYERGWMLRRVS